MIDYKALLHSPIISPKTIPLIEKAGKATFPLLIVGEKGTGKELIARIVHLAAGRDPSRFFRIDCKFLAGSALGENLIGLQEDLKGKGIEGTIYLKEIGSLDKTNQLKLLEWIEDSLFQRESRPSPLASLRVISSSSENLRTKVIHGEFLEDLYDRLATFLISIPPLRERTSEMRSIVRYILDVHWPKMNVKKKTVTDRALKLLQDYWWPGNLRELEQVLLRASMVSDGETLSFEDLCMATEGATTSFASFVEKLRIERAEKRVLEEENQRFQQSPIFFLELVHRIRNPLVSIKTFTQLLREKFDDEEFKDYFYKIVTEDIERIDALLNGLLSYIRINTPEKKKNTVHGLLEEIVKKFEHTIAEKRIRIIRKLDSGLPETAIDDEQLRYILESIFRYALAATIPAGSIGLVTRSLDIEDFLPEGMTEKLGERYLEITVVFTGSSRSAERLETVLGNALSQPDEAMDLELRLVKNIVQKNRGSMRLELNETRTRTLISIRLPVERRQHYYYEGAKT